MQQGNKGNNRVTASSSTSNFIKSIKRVIHKINPGLSINTDNLETEILLQQRGFQNKYDYKKNKKLEHDLKITDPMGNK